MDDMDPVAGDELHQRLYPRIATAGETVMAHPRLVAQRLACATGVVVAAKRSGAPAAGS